MTTHQHQDMEALSDHVSVRYQLTSPLASDRVNWACVCIPAGQSSRLAQCTCHVRGNGKPKTTVRLGPEGLSLISWCFLQPLLAQQPLLVASTVSLKSMEPLTNEPHCLPELTGGYNDPYVEKLVSCPHASAFLRALSSFRIFPSVAGFEFVNKQC